jgi:hypothetical protein
VIFFEPEMGSKTATLKELIAAVEPYFAKGWKNYENEILRELTFAANNYTFLNEFVDGEIKNGSWPKLYGAQSFLCHEGEDFFVRLNLWFPEKETPVAEQMKKYFSIGLLHNHNFPLFTAGLFGPGYTTQLFRWDDVTYDRKVGDRVDINFTAEPTLAMGAGLYIERDSDYHLQIWPKAFSISLNIIPTTKEDYSACQLVLNKDRAIQEILYTGVLPTGTGSPRSKPNFK